MNKKLNKHLLLLKERIFWVGTIIALLFSTLIIRFYSLQIIGYDVYEEQVRASVERIVELPTIRGLIFDRYGRPLAVNKPTHTLQYDQKVKLKDNDLNALLLEVIQVIETEGGSLVNNVPISLTEPFKFTSDTKGISRFIYTIPYQNEVHRRELLTYTAPELMSYLKQRFKISSKYSEEEARKIIALRSEIYAYSFKQYQLVQLAEGLSDEAVTLFEEQYKRFPGMSIEIAAVRYYPEGEITSNIIGYTRRITEAQYKEMKDLGYNETDSVGQMGIEKSMEQDLKGEKGKEIVEIDNMGKRVSTIMRELPVQGNDVFLTIDLELQKATYNSIEKRLSEALIERLKGESRNAKALTGKEVILSILECNQLNIDKMSLAEKGSIQEQIYKKLITTYEQIDPLIVKDISLKDLLLQWIDEETGDVTKKDILLALDEQGVVPLGQRAQESIRLGIEIDSESILIEQLKAGYLKPNQLSVDPFSATAMAVDVQTGEVLSMVGYPSYNNNQMITDFNNYWAMLNNDGRSMLWDRALKTIKAPGSTFKMITAIAGLEEGVITPSTIIDDKGTFTKAGEPYPRCWIASHTGDGHGLTNLNRALEVSCNYYFYEVAYRLSKGATNTYTGINTLTKYVEMFGLDQKTGIELDELAPNISSPTYLVKKRITEALNTLKNVQSEKVAEVKYCLKKGIYQLEIEATSKQINAETKLIEDEVKRHLEPLLQTVLREKYEVLLEACYERINEYLQENMEVTIDRIVTLTMESEDTAHLKEKVSFYLADTLGEILGDTIDKTLEETINEIPSNTLLDVYDNAYTKIYRNEIRKSADSLFAQQINKRLDELNSKEDSYKEDLILKIRQNMINAIVNNLLYGVELNWTDGITVRTAIGQGNNAFSPPQMARYIAALANGKQTFDLTIIDGIYDSKEKKQILSNEVKNPKTLALAKTTIGEIHKGMLAVSIGNDGTAKGKFDDLPFEVAAKTGTAQEGSHEHSWFVAFAPYDKPQIAIVVAIYNADGLDTYNSLIARDMFTSYFKLDYKKSETTLDNTWTN